MVAIKFGRTMLLAVAWLLPAIANADLTARFDRDTVRINETVRLIVETDSVTGEKPNLSALDKNFNVLNQATSQNVSIVNGKQSTVLRYIIDLEPREVGSFSIDPIKLGSDSTPILRVTVLPEQSEQGKSPEVFLETEVELDTVYVQQQLQLTVRLFVAPRLLDGALPDPSPASTRVERLGEDKRYQTSRNGRDYLVYERLYALFPQQSGELQIPPIHFQGLAEEEGAGRGQVFGSLMSQGRRVRANSSAINITVKPPNPEFTGRTWLPVSQLQIDEVGDVGEQVEAGQPLTRKLQLQAQGITAEQLPEIDFGKVDGVRFYPDKPVRDTAEVDGKLVAVQQDNVAVIASSEGIVTLPPVEIDWWNTVTDKPQKAILPARDIRILPSSKPVAAPPVPPAALPSNRVDSTISTDQDLPVQDNEPVASTSDLASKNKSFWKSIAIGSMALWLLTVILFLLLWQQLRSGGGSADRHTDRQVRSAEWRNRLKKACRKNHAVDARRALSGWALATLSIDQSLQQLAAESHNAELAHAMEELDQLLYGSKDASGEWRGDRLWNGFQKLLPIGIDTNQDTQALSPLYPRPERT